MSLVITLTTIGGTIDFQAEQTKATTVELAVEIYMDARCDVLKKAKTKNIETVVVEGIITDEYADVYLLETITYIDGNNSKNMVNTGSMSLSNTGLIGFAHPAYASSTHTWKESSGKYVCTQCGFTQTVIPEIM